MLNCQMSLSPSKCLHVPNSSYIIELAILMALHHVSIIEIPSGKQHVETYDKLYYIYIYMWIPVVIHHLEVQIHDIDGFKWL